MTARDLVITPIFFILILSIAYFVRPYVTNQKTKVFFIPALIVRMAAAILLGVLYQFYYGGGDTFNYFTHGSKWIWEAFQDNLYVGLKFLTEEGGAREMDTFEYSQHIWYYKDENSFFIVRIAAFFDLFTFHTYSSTALFFALFSFSGLWAMFRSIQERYPEQTSRLAFSILFIPSVIFWGSGILKDTITLGALGWLVFTLFKLLEKKSFRFVYFVILLVSAWIIASIKVYILLCLLPGIIVWILWKNLIRLKSTMSKIILVPILFFLSGFILYLLLQNVSKLSDRYTLENINERIAITAYDIRYGWGARTDGDGGYDIGLPDGTWWGTLKLFPSAVNVSLFRPYLWEVRNPLMLLSFLESCTFLILTINILFWKRRTSAIRDDPFLIFCLIFSILFAFAVGVSTFNFGTLMRYKIPGLMFYGVFLALMKSNNEVE